ncbi:hypothetical protein EON65_48410 [archaeon]|nr:MAG: hypothetical protein EON65_48410 [archaeon]
MLSFPISLQHTLHRPTVEGAKVYRAATGKSIQTESPLGYCGVGGAIHTVHTVCRVGRREIEIPINCKRREMFEVDFNVW